MHYTFVNVCCGAEKKLFNNVTCNHDKPSSHISQLHPFDAPCWAALPNYGTDAHWIPSGAIVGANNDWPSLWIAHSHCRAATRFHTHPRRLDCRRSPAHPWKPEANRCGFASASSALELPQPMIAEAGYLCGLACSQKFPWAGGLFLRSFIHARGKDPDANLGGLVPAANAIGVNVYVDHSSRSLPPLIMPHSPPWKPSRHQSSKNFTQNQTHVRWRATEHISPAHTKTSPL
ncbi:hypothetical protein O181_093466 [Austropuccinia psidii MF-1]|uniref:Uncharacterized protein n=1 Tax=Austropuccinia psidii MF-1 TaxID=1389203 RepID=A0A9Q3J1C6_9BASI|nr:hypothetical protein [Austropuccinia psidii MF-1]